MCNFGEGSSDMSTANHRRQPDFSFRDRTPKRVRVSAVGSTNHMTQNQESEAVSETRSRGWTACEKCRSRKTKCDGQRPSCGYCSKNNITCLYSESTQSSACALAGSQILNAIGELSALVQRQHNQCTSCSKALPRDSVSFQTSPEEVSSSLLWTPGVTESGLDAEALNLIGPFSKRLQPPFQPQGIESILTWSSLAHLGPFGCLFSDKHYIVPSANTLPNVGLEEICRLEAKYIDGVHTKNPVLDLTDLHQMVLHVAENGLDWSTQTCLVALVCAIGAITQQYQDQHMSPNNHPTPGAPPVLESSSANLHGSEPDLSAQFWSLASKRLGLAIGQNTVRAVQCLCLAGIWFMHQMEPVRAWQYFNLAGSTWYAITMTENASTTRPPMDAVSGSGSIMQALYFTTWKSLCELRLEIDVPGVFDNVGLPYDFPMAPNESTTYGFSGFDENQRSWYYYLTEIAARHQINRIVNALSSPSQRPTNHELRRMLALADTLETQIHDWHASLPPMFRFDIPEGFSVPPHPNDMTQILRSRYFTCRELVGRPFVRLCVDTALDYDATLRDRVLAFASQGLQFCMLKLSQVAPHRHQGAWFGLRNAAAATLTLCAVELARRSPRLTGARDLPLPKGWQERAAATNEILSPFWDDSRGGAFEIGAVIHSVMVECMTGPDTDGLRMMRSPVG